jgi:hypothetical protein
MTPHQANEGLIKLPLMRRAKIKIKNKKIISGDPKVAVTDPSSAAILCSCR